MRSPIGPSRCPQTMKQGDELVLNSTKSDGRRKKKKKTSESSTLNAQHSKNGKEKPHLDHLILALTVREKPPLI